MRSEPPPPQETLRAPRTPAIQDSFTPASAPATAERPLAAGQTPEPVTAELDLLMPELPPSQVAARTPAIQDSLTPEPTEASLGAEPTAAPVTAQEALLEDPAFAQLNPEGQNAVLRNAEALGRHRGAQQNLRDLATSEGFAALNPDQQQAMLNIQAGAPTDRQLTEEIMGLSADPAFRGLEDSVKTNSLVQLSHHPTDEAARETLTQLATSPGFASLPTEDQNRLLNFAGGTNDLSTRARGALDALMGSDGFQNAALEQQQAQLSGLLRDTSFLPRVVSALGGLGTLPADPYTLHGPTLVEDHPFRSGAADANRYEVDVGGRRIPVYVPVQPNAANGSFHSIDQVAQGLAALPDSGRALVNQVSVEPERNPDDAHWAQVYNNPDFRAYMSADVNGDINLFPSEGPRSQETLNSSLIHETGHTRSMQAWGHDESSARWAEWRTAAESDGIWASDYATDSPGEDFSEALSLYERVRGTSEEAEFRAMMPERFRILDGMLAGTP